MKRVLVTGGLGFIGYHLSKALLAEGYQVWIVDDFSNNISHAKDFGVPQRNLIPSLILPYLANGGLEDNQKVIMVEGDFANKDLLWRIQCSFFDKVFHLAAKPRVQWSVENPVISTQENFTKSIILAKACAVGNTRIIFSSTAAVYDSEIAIPTKEDDQMHCNPVSPYGMAKYATERYLRLFQNLYNLDWVALRYFNVYGPKQPGNSPYATAIAAWCSKAAAEEPLRSDGDGTQTRDMIYVTDIVSANLCVAKADIKNEVRIFNVGSGVSYSNNKILETFAAKGYKNVVQAPERPGDIKHTLADISKLRELGWEPKVSFDEGLELVMNYWGL